MQKYIFLAVACLCSSASVQAEEHADKTANRAVSLINKVCKTSIPVASGCEAFPSEGEGKGEIVCLYGKLVTKKDELDNKFTYEGLD